MQFLRPVEALAERGNRVLVTMSSDHLTAEDLNSEPQSNPLDGGKKKPDPPLHRDWKVTLTFEPHRYHPLYFKSAEGWTVMESFGDRLLAIEKNFGKGSVVLMTETSAFNNDTVVKLQGLDWITSALGPYRRIVFDEQHLGIEESSSIVGMARRFRLTGLGIGLGLCAFFFIWRNASSFPPPAPVRSASRFSGRTSQAGLLTLLRRHIPKTELAKVCWREWLIANRHQTTPDRIEKAVQIAARPGDPVAITREIQTVLQANGEL